MNCLICKSSLNITKIHPSNSIYNNIIYCSDENCKFELNTLNDKIINFVMIKDNMLIYQFYHDNKSAICFDYNKNDYLFNIHFGPFFTNIYLDSAELYFDNLFSKIKKMKGFL